MKTVVNKTEQEKDEFFLSLVKDAYDDFINGYSSPHDVKEELSMIKTIRDNMKYLTVDNPDLSEEEINRKINVINYVNEIEVKISKALNMKAFW